MTIAVGIQDRPSAAPQQGVWKPDYKLFNNPSFSDAASAVSSLVFAYAGTPAFFSIASEMRDPRQYTKALVVCQTVISTAYIVVGIVVYYYCGSYVSSPALGSAGPVVKKVAYGIALPGLLVTAILLTHVSNKKLRLARPRANQEIDPGKIRFCAHSAWLKPPDLQLGHPLDYMAMLHTWCYRDCVYYCKWHSSLWWTCVSGRCSIRHRALHAAYGLHVAV